MTTTSRDRADQASVLEELSRRFDELTGSQKRIVEFIVRNPEQIAFMTLEKLAETIGVSPSTVVRFCYRLGYDGFTDLQSDVQAWLRARLNVQGGRSPAGEPAGSTLLDQAIDRDLRNLQETRRLLRPEDVQRAVDLIVAARQVCVTGIRSTHGVAAALTLGLNKVQGNALLLGSPDDALSEQMVSMSPDDVLVAISFPRYSTRPLDAARYAHQRGIKVVAITDSLISPLARLADVVLLCAYEGLGVQNSLTAPLSLVQAMVDMVAAARRDDYQERLKDTEELIVRWNIVVLNRRDQTSDEA